MTGDVLLVLIGDEVAGRLERGAADRLTFSYDERYRAQRDPVPLSVSMPVAVARHSGDAVAAWLWGLLPDDDRVLRRWAERFDVRARSPFGLLGAPVGRDCAGAVSFVRPEGLDDLAGGDGVTWLSDDDVAARLRHLQQDTTGWLGADFTGRFSLAGAQAKTALLRADGRWGLPRGTQATTHILKPAVAGFDQHDLDEHLCLRSAALVGLDVVRTEVADFGDLRAVVVERYDRAGLPSGEPVRVHQEDVCQSLGLHPSLKYQAEGGPRPSDVASLFRRVMPAAVAERAVWRFAQALAWNWVIAGTDAHAKNYSLLLGRGQVRFAPLYDIASALPYGHERDLRMAMKLGDDYRLHVQRPSTWAALGRDLRLPADDLRAEAVRQAAAAPEAMAKAAGEVEHLHSAFASRLVEAVTARAARCAAMAG